MSAKALFPSVVACSSSSIDGGEGFISVTKCLDLDHASPVRSTALSLRMHFGPSAPHTTRKYLPRAGATLLLSPSVSPAGSRSAARAAMASDARLSLPCRLPSPLPPPVLRRLPRAAAAASTSPRCRVGTTAAVPARTRSRARGPCRPRASEGEAKGQVQQQEVVDSNVLPYCSIDRKQKKTIGEMEQEFLQALQARARARVPFFLSR